MLEACIHFYAELAVRTSNVLRGLLRQFVIDVFVRVVELYSFAIEIVLNVLRDCSLRKGLGD